MRKKILYVVSDEKYFFSHRLSLAVATREAGYRVGVALPHPHDAHVLTQKGIEVFPLSCFHRSSLSPFSALRSFLELCKVYRTFQPDLVHHVALKMTLLGTLAAQKTKVPVIVNGVAGMGYLFTQAEEPSLIKRMTKQGVRALVNWGMKKISCAHPKPYFIVQNREDERSMRQFSGCVVRIPGVGVSLVDYPISPLPDAPPIKVVFLARLLKEKGIFDFLKAAKILYAKGLNEDMEFMLYGEPDPHNPGSLSVKEITEYINEDRERGPLIRWAGGVSSSALAYKDCHMVVLPSYREGLPKSLLEALSCGRPIITTDVPGCRDVVIPELTGILVPPGHPLQLSEAILRLARDPQLRRDMGLQGRKYAERHYDEIHIHKKFIDFFNKCFVSQE